MFCLFPFALDAVQLLLYFLLWVWSCWNLTHPAALLHRFQGVLPGCSFHVHGRFFLTFLSDICLGSDPTCDVFPPPLHACCLLLLPRPGSSGQGVWSAAVTVAVPPLGLSASVSVLQAMVWTLIPLAVAMVSSNIRRVWASRPEHLPEDERGLKTVRVRGVADACWRLGGGGFKPVLCVSFSRRL